MVKMYDDKLIVITGAAGFIGSGVVRHLNEKGMENLLLVDDIEQSDRWKNLLGKRFVDFISKHELFAFLEGRERDIEAFIHLGACSDTLESNGDYLMQNNTRYTIRLAEYALKHGHRFIYASSAATYGNGQQGFSDDHDGLDDLRPLNLYGFSKHLFDLWAKRQGVLSRVTGLKYFNVFGPNEHHKGRMASMVHKMVPILQKEGTIRLFKSSEPEKFADGEQTRDFIYIKDVAKMTCDFLENGNCGIFNIGYGKATTWKHLSTSLFKALGIPVNIQFIEMPQDLIGQYQNHTCAEMGKYLKMHPQFSFQYNVEQGVIDCVQNHLLKDVRW